MEGDAVLGVDPRQAHFDFRQAVQRQQRARFTDLGAGELMANRTGRVGSKQLRRAGIGHALRHRHDGLDRAGIEAGVTARAGRKEVRLGQRAGWA